jgi:hypothetical protein
MNQPTHQVLLPYNRNRRTSYGIEWHEKRLISRLEKKLHTATSAQKRDRYNRRLAKARVRLQVHLLSQALSRK